MHYLSYVRIGKGQFLMLTSMKYCSNLIQR